MDGWALSKAQSLLIIQEHTQLGEVKVVSETVLSSYSGHKCKSIRTALVKQVDTLLRTVIASVSFARVFCCVRTLMFDEICFSRIGNRVLV